MGDHSLILLTVDSAATRQAARRRARELATELAYNPLEVEEVALAMDEFLALVAPRGSATVELEALDFPAVGLRLATRLAPAPDPIPPLLALRRLVDSVEQFPRPEGLVVEALKWRG